MTKYIWYFGYGSNTMKERFFCYINGIKFKWGGSDCTGCTDKTLPIENKWHTIKHELFFAKKADSWGKGGVAFITVNSDENMQTYGRMWKITEEQFSEIWKHEGKIWYNEKIDLESDYEGVPIWTITSNDKLDFNKPSEKYVKTIMCGLAESDKFKNKKDEEPKNWICDYLSKKDGIKNEYSVEELKKLFDKDEP